ncbi:MAG TPA: glycoside hydrolase family 88 protein, partial [Rectinemataceae bacterium]
MRGAPSAKARSIRDSFAENRRLASVLGLAESLVAAATLPLRWMWGEALLVYSLAELGAALSPENPMESPCFAFAAAACDAWARQAHRVDQSDTAAPALALWAVQSRRGGHAYDPLLDRVIAYMQTEPRLHGDIPNHLGHSPEGRLYPKSIWVDSLMMLGLFPALYGYGTAGADPHGADPRDSNLRDLAARLPAQFASLLQDPESKLWRHAWWAGAQSATGRIFIPRGPFPARPIFWARGNGWVIRALSLIMDALPEDHQEFPAVLKIFRESSEALLRVQRPDGWFGTLLDEASYRESSATLLVSGGWL